MTVALARSTDTLEDRWTADEGWLYMTGMQALVRLPIQQRLRDEAAGLNTGGLHFRLSRVAARALRHRTVAGRGASRAPPHRLPPGPQRGPRGHRDLGRAAARRIFPARRSMACSASGTARARASTARATLLRHANFAGASPKGGVIALAGDDHGAKSSTAANFSDLSFIAVGMPVLYPSNTQELLDYGLHGIAMSRYSGCWVGMKIVTDVAEGGGTVYVAPDSPSIVMPAKGPACRAAWAPRVFDTPIPQEERLYEHKLPAALTYARANRLNRIVSNPPGARVGVVAAGKAWQDLLQALGNLGASDKGEGLGLRLLKVGMVWPLDPSIVREFAEGLDLIVVVEEKRPLLEDQIRSILYGGRAQSSAHRREIPRRRRFRSRSRRPRLAEFRRGIARNGGAAAYSGAAAPSTRTAPSRRPRRGTPPAAMFRPRCAAPASARAARTTARRACRKAAGLWPASAVTGWRCSSIRSRPTAHRTWAARA